MLSYIKIHCEEKSNDECIKNIIDSTVKYIEQVRNGMIGEKKFQEAKKIIVDRLDFRGIKLSEGELKILIESSVNGLNKI